MKSFRPKGEGDTDDPASSGGRNLEVDFKGEKRSNETHESTTDPEARLYRKGAGMEAKLCFIGHALMENRSGLIVDTRLTAADGHAERIAALAMIEARADRPRAVTLGTDKGYDAEDFVNELLDAIDRRAGAGGLQLAAPPSKSSRLDATAPA